MTAASLFDAGARALEQGDYPKAIDCFEKLLMENSTVEATVALAEAYLETGSHKKAHQCLTAGLEKHPEDIDLLFALADYCFEYSRPDEALKNYQQIIDLDPQEVEAYVCKAMVLLSRDEFEEAAALCHSALKVQPDQSFALNALGDIYAQQGKFEAAIDLYRQAAELDPEDSQPLLNLADALYEEGNLDEAEQCCLKGLELDPSVAMGYFILGSICLDQDRTREAVEHFEQFLRLEKSPSAQDLRAEVTAVLDGLK